uniref:Cation-transporting P-type ATPase C-terminal domain-containing protein n=1 Tax=Panagrolaimus sp. JU765 TaxID=591449 RepID=A0AC34Q312_9BILA
MEGDLMHRPPRRRNKIISSKTLLLYSYGYAGFIQSFGAFVAYCIVFMTYGIHLPDLFMSSVTYWQDNAPDFVSNNHTFTWQEQMHINRQACSAWFIGIVIGQLFHILNARTRRISIFKHGIFACPQSILGMITAVTLGCIIVYVPGVNTWFGGEAIGILPWLGAAGVGCFMFGFNEIRKYFIRNYPTNNAVRLFKW